VSAAAALAVAGSGVARAPVVATEPSVGLFWGRPDRGHRLAQALRVRGVPVTHYNTQAPGGAPFVRLRGAFVPDCARILRTDHDVYLASLTFVPALCVWVNRRLRGKPYVFNATAVPWAMYRDRARGKPLPAVFASGVYPALIRLILGGASRIVCNSRFVATCLGQRFPAYTTKLTTIYNGIDAERFTAAARRGGDAPTVVCVTTLNFDDKARGLEVVLDAFGCLRERHPAARLVVAAKVSHRRYADRARAWRDARPCRDAVTLHFNSSCVPELMAGGDVFAFATAPDSNDSLPRVLLEAHAAGLPCVVSDTTGCGEAVADGATGFVVPYEAAAMAAGLDTLLRDAALRRRFGDAGRRRVAQVFGWDAMADAYLEVFRDVAARG
jgi:glycosyltransferase involved in cell wall biosynthesis